MKSIFYCVGMALSPEEYDFIQDTSESLTEFLGNTRHILTKQFLVLPFWDDSNDEDTALDFPPRCLGDLENAVSLAEKVQQKFNLNARPIIYVGDDVAGIADRVEFFLGLAYPLPDDQALTLKGLQETGLPVSPIQVQNLGGEVRLSDAFLEIVGTWKNWYIGWGEESSRHGTKQVLFLGAVTWESILGRVFLDAYKALWADFPPTVQAVTGSYDKGQVGGILWCDDVSDDISWQWPKGLAAIGSPTPTRSQLELVQAIGEEIGITLRPLSRLSFNKSGIRMQGDKVVSMEIHNHPLTTIPPEICLLPDLETLEMTGTKICKLPPNLTKLKNLVQITINDGALEEFPPVFLKMKQLQNISLQGNKISTLPTNIAALSDLEILNLRKNQIQKLPANFGKLHKMRRLILDSNHIETLPPSIGGLEAFEFLSLKNNPLTSLPDNFAHMTKLETMDLENTCLTRLPDSIGLLPTLKTLRISQETPQGFQFPAQMGEMDALETLRLNNLGLTEFPAVLLEIPNLKSLYLHNNQIRKIPEEIERMKHLQDIRLGNNLLEDLPIGLNKLPELVLLDIANNKFKSLPKWFVDLPDRLNVQFDGQLESRDQDNPICRELIRRRAPYSKRIKLCLVGVDPQDLDAVESALAKCIVHAYLAQLFPKFFDLNREAWDLLKRGWRTLSYKVGITMAEDPIVKEAWMRGFGKDLAAASLADSDRKEDLEEAVRLFEEAKSISQNGYSPDIYAQVLEKLKKIDIGNQPEKC